MTSKERVKRFRYAKSLENSLAKLQRLVSTAPPDFEFPVELELGLIDLLGNAVGVEPEFVQTANHVGFQFMLDKTQEIDEITEETILSLSDDVKSYGEWKGKEVSKKATARIHQKMSRNKFCEQVLGASLTNPRWGWVGVKEPSETAKGELYLFGWHHNKGRDGKNTVGLFSEDVSIDSNGRRRPGHRDALEKIQRVQAGELEPFIVWQTAIDPEASPKSIESLNGEFVTACHLYVDKKGYWTAQLLENKFLI